MKQVLSDLRARGFVIRKRGADTWHVRDVWPSRLSEHALRTLHASGARRAGGA